MAENLKIKLQYYGISPWEIEVLYGFLNARFTVLEEMIESNDENFVSFLSIDIPLEFNEAFFKWFDFKRWEKVKDVFKEYKRRRGSRNPLKIKINFAGNPKIFDHEKFQKCHFLCTGQYEFCKTGKQNLNFFIWLGFWAENCA